MKIFLSLCCNNPCHGASRETERELAGVGQDWNPRISRASREGAQGQDQHGTTDEGDDTGRGGTSLAHCHPSSFDLVMDFWDARW